MVTMMLLAAVLLAARAGGVAVGWGSSCNRRW